MRVGGTWVVGLLGFAAVAALARAEAVQASLSARVVQLAPSVAAAMPNYQLKTGLDCKAYVQKVYAQAGVKSINCFDQGVPWDDVNEQDLMAGDVVANIPPGGGHTWSGGDTYHTAIVVEVQHTTFSDGVTIVSRVRICDNNGAMNSTCWWLGRDQFYMR